MTSEGSNGKPPSYQGGYIKLPSYDGMIGGRLFCSKVDQINNINRIFSMYFNDVAKRPFSSRLYL